MANKKWTEEEIKQTLRRIGDEAGRPVTQTKVARMSAKTGLKVYHVQDAFGTFSAGLRAAGEDVDTSRERIPNDRLLSFWGECARNHGHAPSVSEYKIWLRKKGGRGIADVLAKRFGGWRIGVPKAFRDYAAGKEEWRDVVELLPADVKEEPAADRIVSSEGEERTTRTHGKRGGPIVGNPMHFRGLLHEPLNEQGVVFLFGMVAKELGYMVEAVQQGFPDCRAKHRIGRGRWETVRIEFEFESRHFVGHPLKGCDVIVCWKHNWPDCPKNIEVLELSEKIKTLNASRG